MSDGPKKLERCRDCPIVALAGIEHGHFCPLIPRGYDCDSVIFERGAPATHVYVVRSGAVVVEGQLSPKTRGSLLGVESLSTTSYDVSAKTREDSVLCEAPREGLLNWLDGLHAVES